MSPSFQQSTSFILDKAHFNECFQQSAPAIQAKDYRKACFIGLMGIGLMFVKSDNYYIAYFLVALGLIEFFSIQHRQTWWVWRQLISKAAHSKVKLIINDIGIITESEQVNSQLLWCDVTSIVQTELGLLLRHKGGTNYLSNSCLSEEMIEFILQHRRVK